MINENDNIASIDKPKSSVKLATFLDKYKILFILLVMIVFLSIATDVFLTVDNIVNVMRQISINTIIACGMTLVIITGGFDLSVGSVVAVGGVISASIVQAGQPVWLALLAGIVAGAVFGYLSGLFITKLNLPPFVATLGTQTIGRGFAYVYVGGLPIVGLPTAFLALGQKSIGVIPIPILIMVIIIILSAILLYQTKFGRYIYFLGGNEEAARFSGINVKRVKNLVYTISGVLAALAGVILASRISAGQPQSGIGYEMDAIAAVVIGGTSLSGGTGSIFGTIIGAIIIGVINNGLNLLNVSPYYQMIAKGVIIVAAVTLDVKTSKKKS